ncbi:30808_t:CDS:1, partial [Racocetra persica]
MPTRLLSHISCESSKLDQLFCQSWLLITEIDTNKRKKSGTT